VIRGSSNALALLLVLFASHVSGQTYPTRTVTLVVPFPNVGGPDVMGRLMADSLRQGLGQPVVVDNRPGAGSNIGTENVARAAPDGHTLLLAVSPPFTTVGAFYPKPPYDPIKDFAPTSLIAAVEMTLIVHSSLPVTNLAEFIRYAKGNPGRLDYGSGGNGTPHHLGMEMLKGMLGLHLVHIPYRGASLALRDLAAGEIKVMFQSYGTSKPFIDAGRVRAIAVTGGKTVPLAPSLPTFASLGYPKLDVTTWYGIVAPAGTPQPILQRLNAEINKIVSNPAVHEKFRALDLEPIAGTQAELARKIETDIKKWGDVIRASNIQAD
jgi:tripartite-type tricarboxylate transporter receptor subunit TctC